MKVSRTRLHPQPHPTPRPAGSRALSLSASLQATTRVAPESQQPTTAWTARCRANSSRALCRSASEGTTNLRYLSVDNAGNRESATSKSVRIDNMAPVSSAIVQPVYYGAVHIDLSAMDALSGRARDLLAHERWRVDKGQLRGDHCGTARRFRSRLVLGRQRGQRRVPVSERLFRGLQPLRTERAGDRLSGHVDDRVGRDLVGRYIRTVERCQQQRPTSRSRARSSMCTAPRDRTSERSA